MRHLVATSLSGLDIDSTIHHPKAGKATFERLEDGTARVTRPGHAKITMITHKKTCEVIVRTDVDQQNIRLAPYETVHLGEVSDG